MSLYSWKWEREKKLVRNTIVVKITLCDESGNIRIVRKFFRNWIGIVTNDIEDVVNGLKMHLPGIQLTYEAISDKPFKELVPFFRDKLLNPEEEEESKIFYKLYTDDSIEQIGLFVGKKHVSYYDESQWLLRISIDIWKEFGVEKFSYNWYTFNDSERNLIKSIVKIENDRIDLPCFQIASFDLETVPWEVNGCRIPDGHNRNDVIVMISLVLGQMSSTGTIDIIEKNLYYLNPLTTPLHFTSSDANYYEFYKEFDLLLAFFNRMKDERIFIVTGYNINKFDFPCLFARTYFTTKNSMKKKKQQKLADKFLSSIFRSRQIGKYIVTTFQNKIVIDMYTFTSLFASRGLPSLKLDVVARAKIGDRKIPISPVSIHKWYQERDVVDFDLLKCRDVEKCVQLLNVKFPMFGDFETCLEYCVHDSVLVILLMSKENVITMLINRAKNTTFDIEEAFYFGNSQYINNLIHFYGTFLGYFINTRFFKNVTTFTNEFDQEVPVNYQYLVNKRYRGAKYQGALNYCKGANFYKNMTVYDFESLYPSMICTFNVSYETFAVMHQSTAQKYSSRVQIVPHRTHSGRDFTDYCYTGEIIPQVGPDDELVMVYDKTCKGYIPQLIETLMIRRRYLKQQYKVTKLKYFDVEQLNTKILINSIYGVMGSTDSDLGNLALGMSVTCFARYILLSVFRFLCHRGEIVPYCDTDSLFVSNCKTSNEIVNKFIDKPFVNLQYETTHELMLILSRKRYCYENDNVINSTGLEVKSNELTKNMLSVAMNSTFGVIKLTNEANHTLGWQILVDLVVGAYITSRKLDKNVLSVKIKALDAYSEKCTMSHVRLMKRSALHRKFEEGQIVNYVNILTDISEDHDKLINPMFVEDYYRGQHTVLDFSKLYVNQQKNILNLLNVGYFKYANLTQLIDEHNKLINLIKWKRVVNAEIRMMHQYGERMLPLFERGARYTFKIAECGLKRKKFSR